MENDYGFVDADPASLCYPFADGGWLAKTSAFHRAPQQGDLLPRGKRDCAAQFAPP